MAKKVTGRLLRDARLIDGKESDGGRLHLRGETVTVDADFAELVDTRAGQRRAMRDRMVDKQARPDATKSA